MQRVEVMKPAEPDPASWTETKSREVTAARRPSGRRVRPSEGHYSVLAARLDDMFLTAMARHPDGNGEHER
jgi:hypothetical protein